MAMESLLLVPLQPLENQGKTLFCQLYFEHLSTLVFVNWPSEFWREKLRALRRNIHFWRENWNSHNSKFLTCTILTFLFFFKKRLGNVQKTWILLKSRPQRLSRCIPAYSAKALPLKAHPMFNKPWMVSFHSGSDFVFKFFSQSSQIFSHERNWHKNKYSQMLSNCKLLQKSHFAIDNLANLVF